jgi:hypothetical protein
MPMVDVYADMPMVDVYADMPMVDVYIVERKGWGSRRG